MKGFLSCVMFDSSSLELVCYEVSTNVMTWLSQGAWPRLPPAWPHHSVCVCVSCVLWVIITTVWLSLISHPTVPVSSLMFVIVCNRTCLSKMSLCATSGLILSILKCNIILNVSHCAYFSRWNKFHTHFHNICMCIVSFEYLTSYWYYWLSWKWFTDSVERFNLILNLIVFKMIRGIN